MANFTDVYEGKYDLTLLAETCLTTQDICCPEGGGNFFPSSDGEYTWPVPLRAILYFIGMAWCFLGVAIIADLFMAAIDQVTSSTKIVKDKDGKKSVTKVW